MKKRTISYSIICQAFFLIATLLVFSACKKDHKPEESFIKIYNDSDGSKNYTPLSIASTSDNGYIILSAYNGWNIHLLKTDEVGDLLWEVDLPSQYVSAVPNLIERNGNLYFVCMDAVGLFSYVMQVDESAQNALEIQAITDVEYPLYLADNGNKAYIQNYERSSAQTGIYELDASLTQVVNSERVEIYVGVEEEIVGHLNHTGKRFPFFISTTPEEDYIIMSGFNNYSFSAVILDANLTFSGVYNGAAFNGGLSAIYPLGGNQFSMARFSYSNLYVNPNVTLSPNVIDVVESIPAQGVAELDAESPVLIKELSINDEDCITYLSTTKSNQLLLSCYRKGTNELIGSKYLGESVPLEAADFLQTADGGLILLTRVTMMGSFNRVATIKLTQEELEAMVQ